MVPFITNTSIYFINSKKVSSFFLTRGEWVCVNDLAPEFLKVLKEEQIRTVFIKQENIFSHAMNVLRKVVLDTDILIVVGVKDIFEKLNNASRVEIDIMRDSIMLDNAIYIFRKFNYLKDSSETIEYNLNTSEICYKPDYFYNEKLIVIITKGYNLSQKYLQNAHSSRSDQEGRIWNSGFIFPSHFFDLYYKNINLYYETLLDYVSVLETLISLKDIGGESEQLTNSLILHYSYSIIFSFITPNISEYMQKGEGKSELELTYNIFVLNSPIHNKTNLTHDALAKVKTFLENICSGMDANDNFEQVYSLSNSPKSNIALMYFVTNMFSDIRRCVINVLIDNNKWFGAICKHRKKPKIY